MTYVRNDGLTGYDFSYAKKGMAVRLAYLLFAIFYFILFKVGRTSAGAIILCYHAVTLQQCEKFARQMRHISSRAVGLDDITQNRFADGAVSVTFDDAFECLISTAVPITKNIEVPIAIFAVTENMGKPPQWGMDEYRSDTSEMIMTEEQLQALDKEKYCLIGSHTVNHRKLAELSENDVQYELQSSKNFLEKLLGHPIKHLALPHGSFTYQVIKLAQDIGYNGILTLEEKSIDAGLPDNSLGRFSVSPDMWMIEFVLTANGSYAWLYRWRKLIRRARLLLRGVNHG